MSRTLSLVIRGTFSDSGNKAVLSLVPSVDLFVGDPSTGAVDGDTAEYDRSVSYDGSQVDVPNVTPFMWPGGE